MTDPTNHACLNGRRCTPGDNPQTTNKPNTLCPRCTARARRHIETLPWQHLQLCAMLGEHNASINPCRTRPDSTVLINTALDTLAGSIHHYATLGAEIVADALAADNPYKHHASAHVAVCCRLIAPNMDKLLAGDTIDIMAWNSIGSARYITTTTGTEIIQQLDHLSSIAHYTLGMTRVRSYRDIPCARCGQQSVGRWSGADSFDCESCGAQFPETEIRRHDRILLERHRRGLIHA